MVPRFEFGAETRPGLLLANDAGPDAGAVAGTYTATDAATYSYAFINADDRDADHGSTESRAVAATDRFIYRSRRNRHGHGLYCARALFGELEDFWS